MCGSGNIYRDVGLKIMRKLQLGGKCIESYCVEFEFETVMNR